MRYIKCNYDAWDEATEKSKKKKRGVAKYKLSKKFKRT
tara:strand:+ start:119 stop:232 length:114 start_codon:yes stop_codon:yes gene_type:complete